MTADQTPQSPQPRPDAGTDDIQAHIEHTGKTLAETVEASSAEADVEGEVKQKVADTKDRITEKAYETKHAAVEQAHAAQSAAREAFTDSTGSLKPGVPITALIAAAVVISAVMWRRRR
jgi:cobalamin biosynthesis Mg chelatase CobN